MISYEEFEEIVVDILKRDISTNEEQNEAISANPNESLFIVAGPGSGKTTVIVLKILKYIFVDDINPTEIMATTFTRKAADELYSRILSWGDQIKKYLMENINIDFSDFNAVEENLLKIEKIDFNQINIGTIDGIAEEVLRVHKEPGTNQPVVIENFIAKAAMVNSGLLNTNRHQNKDLQEFLKAFSNYGRLEEHPEKMGDILLEMKNRMYYDQIDKGKLLETVNNNPGAIEALNAIKDYEEDIKRRNIIDFPMLEAKFLKYLKNNKLDVFLDDIKIILVDEYQDTNLIQEEIYFTIAKSALKNGGNITVVGDDDQSLYRFRGATVDLFTNFKKRAFEKLGIEVKEINLRTNYRSSKNIINHCNRFVEIDHKYQHARVEEKPKIIAPNLKTESIPVLGMFRNNVEMLTHDLALMIGKLVNKGEVDLKVKKIIKHGISEPAGDVKKITLKLDEEYGSASDIAVLTFSPKETNLGKNLFPFYLRKNLERLKKPIYVYNPRGQDLQDIEEVAIFCGLMLECIDPEQKIEKNDKGISNLAKRNMNKWRRLARDFIKTNPEPHEPFTLKEFVTAWQLRQPKGHEKWPETASLMELAYKLITWIEPLQEDVEGIVYLEAITQTITQTGFFNKFSGHVYFDSEENNEESIKEAIYNIFIPIATGGVEIDESLLETLPNDRINIMSIHQSKGLEFPLVIVDVGSRFNKNDVRTQRFRFPKKPPEKESLEDAIRNHSALGKNEREEKDRAFDDLTRLYFVAFSRAENVLILVGLNQGIDGYNIKNKKVKIPNVALGWDRDENFKGFDEIYMI
ncbi:MAG: UvrD-helicase domain-containing protein [Methanobrevibacter sp.]|uniref:UvrD-helicase domain-containing protein n=1 Tax=Methanobrevibacter sp. TaxID=66852 RepID=UPI0026DFFCDD|nr:UvrD-helicase domain-containing protein [Methanobrevibacter sp.]MDO5849228.1 UvrD-helicase domain-containing protein [Methanobrevibacter sp.]